MTELVLSAPGLNALSGALMQQVVDTLDAGKGEPILLTGEGRAFSAGLNLKEVVSLDGPGLTHFLGLLAEACSKIYHYPGPIVAAINGHAIAGGCLLALFCDQRILSNHPKVRMGLNEVVLGVGFPPNLMSMLRARIPARHIDTVLLGGQLHDPEACLRLGLVDRLSDDALTEGRAVLAHLASHPRAGYVSMKANLRDIPADPDLDKKVGAELAQAWSSPEIRARMSALVSK